MQVIYKNRYVEIESISDSQYPEDIYIEKAYFVDTEEDITDAKILDDILFHNHGQIYNEWFQNKVDQAEYLYEGDR